MASGNRDLGWSRTPEKKMALTAGGRGGGRQEDCPEGELCVGPRWNKKMVGTTLHVRFDVLVFTGNAWLLCVL